MMPFNIIISGAICSLLRTNKKDTVSLPITHWEQGVSEQSTATLPVSLAGLVKPTHRMSTYTAQEQPMVTVNEVLIPLPDNKKLKNDRHVHQTGHPLMMRKCRQGDIAR